MEGPQIDQDAVAAAAKLETGAQDRSRGFEKMIEGEDCLVGAASELAIGRTFEPGVQEEELFLSIL